MAEAWESPQRVNVPSASRGGGSPPRRGSTCGLEERANRSGGDARPAAFLALKAAGFSFQNHFSASKLTKGPPPVTTARLASMPRQ